MPLKSTLDYETRVAEAAQAYDSGQFSSVAAAARKFEVARRTVSHRLDGIPPRTAKTPTNKALNPIQEDALLYWIRFLNWGAHRCRSWQFLEYDEEQSIHMDDPNLIGLMLEYLYGLDYFHPDDFDAPVEPDIKDSAPMSKRQIDP